MVNRLSLIRKHPEWAEKGILFNEDGAFLAEPGSLFFEASQEKWTQRLNKVGRTMAAAPDLYQAARENNAPFLSELNNLLENKKPSFVCLLTSTCQVYNPEDSELHAVHYFGSTQVLPRETGTIKLNSFEKEHSLGTPLESVLGSLDGSNYLQQVFGTSDTPQKMGTVLGNLLRSDLSEMLISFPEIRRHYPLQPFAVYSASSLKPEGKSYVLGSVLPYELGHACLLREV